LDCSPVEPVHISFVVGARNDNYGGDLLYRMQVFSDTLLAQWDRLGLNAELIVVEWNPPLDRRRLWQELSWPPRQQHGRVRFIEVPEEIHRRFPNADRMPHFEYLAKNAGIRRADGEFILATNPDLVFSEELMRFISRGGLSDECFYRTNRYDLACPVPIQLSLEEKLTFCQRNTFRVHRHQKTVKLYLHRRMIDWIKGMKNRLMNGLGQGPREEKITNMDDVHTYASGDFLLIAKDAWFELHGYPDIFTHSHIDSIMCWAAASLPLKQVVMNRPMCIYHQEHDRSAHDERPLTEFRPWKERVQEALSSGNPLIYNDEDWGLAGEELEEHVLIGSNKTNENE